MIHDALAGSTFSYDAGVAGTVTVPAGVYVDKFAAHASAAGATVTITPNGANQTGTAGAAIPIPAVGWFGDEFMGQIGPGTVFVFTGTDSYYVRYAKFQAGAAR